MSKLFYKDENGNPVELAVQENVGTKVNQIQSSATNEQYPSAKAVKDYVDSHSGGGNIDDIINQSGDSLITNRIATITPFNIGAATQTDIDQAIGLAIEGFY